jgi:rod shape determining protein RodA
MKTKTKQKQTDTDGPNLTEVLAHWHVDLPLLLLLLSVSIIGLFTLYSASGHEFDVVLGQFMRLMLGLTAMVLVAQIPSEWYRVAAPFFYIIGSILLVLVLVLGDAAKGAQRWLDLGILRFQPSEIMKMAVPMTIAAYLHLRPLPPRWMDIVLVGILIAIPVGLVAKQPDLGTSILIAAAGGFVLFMAGLRWRFIILLLIAFAAAGPTLWVNLHDYQQQRVLTFLDPERDPSGAGYHITQSKIAIGSGGLLGKGWMNSSQAKLDFLPESHTDFIFAVYAEEMGLLGVLLLLALYCGIVARGLYIALRGQDMFQRLVAGGLSFTFFLYVFINMGMVAGILPVVGVPLPMISFGGTSMVIMLASFGILMSIHTHRKLISS